VLVDILGWKQPSEEEIREEKDALMRSEYFNSIEIFPDKINQLLDAINRVNFDRYIMNNIDLFIYSFISVRNEIHHEYDKEQFNRLIETFLFFSRCRLLILCFVLRNKSYDFYSIYIRFEKMLLW
jgi:hypothetical protein